METLPKLKLRSTLPLTAISHLHPRISRKPLQMRTLQKTPRYQKRPPHYTKTSMLGRGRKVCSPSSSEERALGVGVFQITSIQATTRTWTTPNVSPQLQRGIINHIDPSSRPLIAMTCSAAAMPTQHLSSTVPITWTNHSGAAYVPRASRPSGY